MAIGYIFYLMRAMGRAATGHVDRSGRPRWLGWVGDFCSICRDFQAFRLGAGEGRRELSLQPDTLDHWIVCEACGGSRSASLADYRAVAKKRPKDLVSLLRQTQPNAAERHCERLELEEDLSIGALADGQRRWLIREAFGWMVLAVEWRAPRRFSRDFEILLTVVGGAFGLMMLPMLGMSVGLSLTQDAPTWVKVLTALCGAGGGLALLLWLLLRKDRYLNKRVYPVLARALAPLRPTVDEIAAELQAMKNIDAAIGHRLRAERIAQLIAGPAVGARTRVTHVRS
jgi:hypothetical protein